MTVQELLDALRDHIREDPDDERGIQLLDQLTVELKLELWGERTFAAALEVFGRSMYAATGQQRRVLDRLIRHANREWRRRYGPMSYEQEQYADEVLAHCITVAGKQPNKWASVSLRLGNIVNNDKVHDGMKRRSGAVDVSEQLKELVS